MGTNLLLLPSLILSLDRTVSNKETIKEPTIDIFPEEKDDDSDEDDEALSNVK